MARKKCVPFSQGSVTRVVIWEVDPSGDFIVDVAEAPVLFANGEQYARETFPCYFDGAGAVLPTHRVTVEDRSDLGFLDQGA